MDKVKEQYNLWRTSSGFDEKTRAELNAIEDDSEIIDRFYCDLAFGTGGLRGIMGAGTNRMNSYVIRRATKGLADYLLASDTDAASRGVAIAYDSRLCSREFAENAATVLCRAGFRTYLFSEITPTPVLSFAVKQLGCAAGIVITASHNPKQYNGYKVYDATGCQVVPHIAKQISDYIQAQESYTNIPSMEMEEAIEKSLLVMLDDSILELFLDRVLVQARLQDTAAKQALKVVFSPLHGTGLVPVMKALARDGFLSVRAVEAQTVPDGNFPTVRAPNPEERDALLMGIEQAERENGDIVLGTDPDCDRVGVAVRQGNKFRLLSGNQIGALLVDFLLSHSGCELNEKSTVVKTIVTNDLGAVIARSRGLQVVDTLTGFKFIGEQINRFLTHSQNEFFMGYEESFGYLVGTHARDKDAVVSSMLICEMAAEAKAKGETLVDKLDKIYAKYGYYCDKLVTLELYGRDGANRIQEIMERFRRFSKSSFRSLTEVKDYYVGLDGLPKADVIKLMFHDGSWLAVRPSGTEPKIKFYYSVVAADKPAAEERQRALEAAADKLTKLS